MNGGMFRCGDTEGPEQVQVFVCSCVCVCMCVCLCVCVGSLSDLVKCLNDKTSMYSILSFNPTLLSSHSLYSNFKGKLLGDALLSGNQNLAHFISTLVKCDTPPTLPSATFPHPYAPIDNS